MTPLDVLGLAMVGLVVALGIGMLVWNAAFGSHKYERPMASAPRPEFEPGDPVVRVKGGVIGEVLQVVPASGVLVRYGLREFWESPGTIRRVVPR